MGPPMSDPKPSKDDYDEGGHTVDEGDSDPASETGEKQAEVNQDRESPA